MRKSWWLASTLVAVVLVAGLVAVRALRVREKESAAAVGPLVPAVSVVAITEGRVAEIRSVLGTVTGAEEADIAPRVMAQVLDVRVREGDRVRRGQVLATLDARELQDGVLAADAALEAARHGLQAADTALSVQEATTARDRVLVESKAIATEQWDRSRAAAASATAQREAARGQVAIAERRSSQARTQVAYSRLSAPFDGVVSARLADPGALAVPGRPLLRLVRGSEVRVRAALPASDFARLRPGLDVTLRVADHPVTAAISRVLPSMGDSRLATFEVDVTDPPAGLVSGATVGVDVALNTATGLSVPTGALLDTDHGTYVFRVVDDVVQPVAVEISVRSEPDAVIRGPLAVDDRVVIAPSSRLMTLTGGQRVRPVTSPAASQPVAGVPQVAMPTGDRRDAR